jgi:signal transduction histidine kinase
MPGPPVLTRPDWVARQRTTLAYLAGLLHAMPPDADALRLLARLFDAVPASDPVEMEAFYGQLSRAIAELVGARRVAFLVRDNGWLRWQREAYGFPAEILTGARLPCGPDGDGLLERVVFKDFILAGPISDDPIYAPYHEVLHALDTSSAIVVPWRAGEERLGAVVAFDPPRKDGPTEQDAWVLRVAAGLAAIVWQRGKELSITHHGAEEAQRLRAVAGQLESLEKAKSDFLSLASHELRAPLAVLGGYLAMLADGSLGQLSTQQEQAVPIMLAKLSQMNTMITRMLEVSKLEDSRMQLHLERLDLAAGVRQAVRELETVTDGGQRIGLALPAEPLYVMADRLRAEAVVQNLLDNALKYSPAGTPVHCTVSRANGFAQVCVQDQGIGIAPADLPTLFTRFGRIIHEEHRNIAGTGLGLYLSRELARMHGGDITVTSTPGQGSEFVFTLPIAKAGL